MRESESESERQRERNTNTAQLRESSCASREEKKKTGERAGEKGRVRVWKGGGEPKVQTRNT